MTRNLGNSKKYVNYILVAGSTRNVSKTSEVKNYIIFASMLVISVQNHQITLQKKIINCFWTIQIFRSSGLFIWSVDHLPLQSEIDQDFKNKNNLYFKLRVAKLRFYTSFPFSCVKQHKINGKINVKVLSNWKMNPNT